MKFQQKFEPNLRSTFQDVLFKNDLDYAFVFILESRQIILFNMPFNLTIVKRLARSALNYNPD